MIRPAEVPDYMVELGLPRPALSTVYRWINNRRLPHRRVGGMIYLSKEEVERWTENQ